MDPVQARVVEAARQAGIAGAGGAAFPTYVKLESKAEIYIANGAECEPLLHVSQELMAREAQAIVGGLSVAMAATGASRGIIALKRKYAAATAALRAAVGDARDIEIRHLDDFYPAGDEHVLVYECTGRRVPAGGIPLAAGVVVNNIETLVNLAHAVAEGRPVTGKWVTVCGSVKRPVTARFPLGTSFREAIEFAGGPSVSRYSVLDGGPLMGKPVTDLFHPITKSTGGIVVLPGDSDWIARLTAPMEVSLRRARSHCIQCMFCTEMCPRYLLGHLLKPNKVMLEASYGLEGPGRLEMSLLCSECGLCEAYACPVNLVPRRVNATLKARLLKQGVKPSREMSPAPDPAREYRRVPTSRLKSRLGLDSFDRLPEFEEEGPRPREVRIMMKQHVGVAAVPEVREGEHVEEGAVIGRVPPGGLGTPVHASISGTAVRVEADAVTIRRSGQ